MSYLEEQAIQCHALSLEEATDLRGPDETWNAASIDAESFEYTRPPADHYSTEEVDDMVHKIYRAHECMTEDYHKSIDDDYYPFNKNIGWLTTCKKEMKHKLELTIQIVQKQQEKEPDEGQSIDDRYQLSIDANCGASES
ncbi:unnamed protein product [Eruca vesicaria subsp. sativa]|uniref:Uncharacterized protein n=1 Tax=Eruca vesicaria subsp. sativa TaxID=29727 RepID=A0ABC8J9P2_ERUVS|nr:unnamed protein product [Eruca vesicaria subsp. sativa]